MENVIRALEAYIYEFEKHTPAPLQRGVSAFDERKLS